MASYGTIVESGSFTSDGAARTLTFVQDVDWMWVYNFTQADATNNVAVQFYWQRGMAAGRGIKYFKSGGGNALNMDTLDSPSGFTLVDDSTVTISAPTTITNVSNANPPRVTAAGHGLVTGDIVRLSNIVGGSQLGGIDFRVTRFDANNFDLSWMAQVAAAAAPGATAAVRKISSEGLYIPRTRVITAITAANPCVVTMAAPHNFTVGQVVRFSIPAVTAVAYGMTELDGLEGTVTAISVANNTITVDIDTSAFTAFAFPLTADIPFTPATVRPVGEDTAQAIASAVDLLGDQVLNEGIRGIVLAGGADTPGGANNDVMYWVAGKSLENNA